MSQFLKIAFHKGQYWIEVGAKRIDWGSKVQARTLWLKSALFKLQEEGTDMPADEGKARGRGREMRDGMASATHTSCAASIRTAVSTLFCVLWFSSYPFPDFLYT